MADNNHGYSINQRDEDEIESLTLYIYTYVKKSLQYHIRFKRFPDSLFDFPEEGNENPKVPTCMLLYYIINLVDFDFDLVEFFLMQSLLLTFASIK